MDASNGPMAYAENRDEPEVGCRPCSCTHFFRYLLFIGGIIGGIVIIFATPRVCPSGYHEQTCYASGNTYDCRDGIYCENKIPPPGAIIGGIILIVLSAILGVLSCCFQSRCLLGDKYYNDKILMCC